MKLSSRLFGAVVAVVFYASGLQCHAVVWFDDFSDGDAGPSPVQWTPSSQFVGDYSVSGGDYVLTPTDDGSQPMGIDSETLISVVEDVIFTDVSVRTQAVVGFGDTPDPDNNADFDASSLVDGNDFLTWQRGSGTSGIQAQGDADFDGQIDDIDLGVWESQFGGPANLRGGNVGVMARWDPVTGNGYLLIMDVGEQWNLLVVEDFGAQLSELNLNNTDPPIDPDTGLFINASSDIVIQLDVTGSGVDTLLEVWFWKPEDPMPATPYFSVTDNLNGVGGFALINEGTAGIIYNEDEANSPGIFRYVEASDTQLTDPMATSALTATVPEPASGVLAALTALAIGLMRADKRR